MTVIRSRFFTLEEMAVRLVPSAPGEGDSLIPRHLTNGRVVAAPERMPVLPRHVFNAGRSLLVADELRHRMGMPLYVSSGSRIDQASGQHPQCLALDLVCDDYGQLVRVARDLVNEDWAPIHQFITYEGTTHIHLGMSGLRADGGWYASTKQELRGRWNGRWTYRQV